MLRRRPSTAKSMLQDIRPRSICCPHQNRRAFSAAISTASRCNGVSLSHRVRWTSVAFSPSGKMPSWP
jgi:hypothetical protein